MTTRRKLWHPNGIVNHARTVDDLYTVCGIRIRKEYTYWVRPNGNSVTTVSHDIREVASCRKCRKRLGLWAPGSVNPPAAQAR